MTDDTKMTPYRDEQILRILADHPDGLTTGQIYEIAQKQHGNELPSSNIISQRIYGMRESKSPKIESLDTVNGRIHRLTNAGRKLLESLGPGDFFTKISDTDTTSDIDPVDGNRSSMPNDDAAPNEADIILSTFDAAVAELRSTIQIAMSAADAVSTSAEPWPKMPDKQAKIELLEKFENMPMFEVWVVDMLGEIRQFIAQFDSE